MALLGTIGHTSLPVLPHKAWMSTAPGDAGEDIFGLFENGFGAAQNNILAALGCANPADGHVGAGFDTVFAESMIARQCGIELPRFDGDEYVSLLDLCGGHTNEYHFHERLSCLYDVEPGHSPLLGLLTDGSAIYGTYEDTDEEAGGLDACGAHFGPTPDSDGEAVYHYHVQEKARASAMSPRRASRGSPTPVEYSPSKLRRPLWPRASAPTTPASP